MEARIAELGAQVASLTTRECQYTETNINLEQRIEELELEAELDYEED